LAVAPVVVHVHLSSSGRNQDWSVMSRVILGFSSFVVAMLVASAPASAQYRGYSVGDPATGEKYHVEARFGLWNPSPNLVVSSESLGIPGDRIDAVTDLGFTQKRFADIHLVLRPARKHKFLFDYIPISYTAEAVLKRNITFNGINYQVNLPVNSSLDWKAYRLGYEYDFIYRDRGFAGFILDVKYTNVRVDLKNPFNHDFAHAAAPIPALGGIVRLYPAANISVTAEVTGVKLPESIDKRYKGHWVDVDVYGTVNFSNNVGAQVGYRSLDVGYTIKRDYGAFLLKGFYVAGVARF
jgi:hypothetical protein